MKKKLVVIGGGTGLPALLKGIKHLDNVDISALVTVADSGGSTGILSRHFDIPAVGDLRRVITALGRNREFLEKSMEYRFKETNTDLDGHTVGNLILTSQILLEKDFAKGILAASKMLNIQGKVLPISNNFNHLKARLEDETVVEGEDKIGNTFNKKIVEIFYDDNAKASQLAINAILEADYIIFGIGSLYTSLIANLIYKDVIDSLKKTKAKILYFANIFTQYGETDNMSLSDHILAIENHTFKNIIDHVIVSNTKISKKILESYEKEKQFLMKNDFKGFLSYDLISVVNKETIRHDEKKIMKCIQDLI